MLPVAVSILLRLRPGRPFGSSASGFELTVGAGGLVRQKCLPVAPNTYRFRGQTLKLRRQDH